jgi:tetratricopeptide (TPR) repeat protein
MSSIIEGYTYDIFISYRQKDNKHDGWVTEFVNNLKGELESTFKEEISVYFDVNPHDGLLETHDVDASLKEKLKCLVFIPILSRTYCDPKSFAWEHEFKAFVDSASKDHFGLKVKLSNGNVASRILPVRIHDLDIADIRLCEFILDGVLRGIEFIYEEPGVDRPLTSDDDENKNLKKTRYRNQVNKVALAINDLIQGLKTEPEWIKFENRIAKEEFGQTEVYVEKEKKTKRNGPIHKSIQKVFLGLMALAILAAVLVFSWPKIFKHDTLEKLRSSNGKISVAVMPFQNMTNDTTKNFWQKMIQDNLITSLSNNPEELAVRQTESINSLIQSKGLTNFASITPSIARTICQKLDANVFVYGSINQAGSTIRVNAQLINAKSEEIFKSFQVDGKIESILHIIDSLSRQVNDFLVISKLKRENLKVQELVFTKSPEAYRYFIYGQSAFAKKDFPSAINLLSQAVAIDSNYTYAALHIVWAFINQGLYDEAKKRCLKVYEKRERMPLQQRIYINFVYATCFETPYERIKYLKQLLEIDDHLPHVYYDLGVAYDDLYQYDKAITAYEKSLEIYKEWSAKPWWMNNYTYLGYAYHKTSQYNKERELYKKAELDFPGDPAIIYNQTVLALSERDTIEANQLIKKYTLFGKEQSWSDAHIIRMVASIYSNANILDKAEKCYRQALLSEPENSVSLNEFAYFLINDNRNVTEGLSLIDKALATSPDNYEYLDTKGWGLFKAGKFKEALELIEKSWNLKPVYSHKIFLHMEEAKKALADQASN